ncbi:MAG TPA: SIMPL domain-containing protein [Anaerolineae bacterium]|nr:SIMPL domain-containing protein [Anaerolineae bacterium]HMR64856.1 SIMPL domain-containing protein [Anaerolineae bacterium]
MKSEAHLIGIMVIVLVTLFGGMMTQIQPVYGSSWDMFKGERQLVDQNYRLSEPVTESNPIHLRIQSKAQTPEVSLDVPVRSVSVSGTGRVDVQPDQAIVLLGVQTDAETASEALNQNSSQMQTLLESLEENGVPADQLETQTVQLLTRYSQDSTPEGYTAANVVEMQVNDLERLGQLLDAAVEAGGNTIQGIRFEVSDRETQLDQARQAAVDDAKRKAEQLTSAFDAQLGQVLAINESSQFPGPLPFSASMAVQADAAAVPIEPGSQTVEVTVQVTWLLE